MGEVSVEGLIWSASCTRDRGVRAAQAMHHEPLSSVGRYTIERSIGAGGMGDVYLAYDTRLRRRVALKVLGAGAAALGVDVLAATLREARAAGAIAHPNATAIFDVGEADGLAFIVMEYVPGELLRRFVGDASVPVATRVRWLVDVAGALAVAHAVGVVHRDVKPENVMVREDGIVKVLDFGVARLALHAEEAAAPAGSATWSNGGGFAGTPGYMAPEVIAGGEVDGRADQFSWAVLAHELLAGRLPWPRSEPPLAALAATLTDEPLPLPADVPPGVAAVLARALAKKAEARFPSLAIAAEALAPFAAAAVPSFRPPPDSIVRLASTPASSPPRPPSSAPRIATSPAASTLPPPSRPPVRGPSRSSAPPLPTLRSALDEPPAPLSLRAPPLPRRATVRSVLRSSDDGQPASSPDVSNRELTKRHSLRLTNPPAHPSFLREDSLSRPARPALAGAIAPPSPKPPGTTMFSKKVLVVTGDVVASRRTYGPMLRGHELVYALDALQTLARLGEHRDTDVVLLDLDSTRRCGVDVIMRLAANPVAVRVPLLVAGADDALLRSIQHARADRPTAYVTPPLRKESLLRALDLLLAPASPRGAER
jgi:serine/threonine-protein kinase